MSMSVMNGFEAARELTKLMPDMPLIMFTHHAGAIAEHKIGEVGVRPGTHRDPALTIAGNLHSIDVASCF